MDALAIALVPLLAVLFVWLGYRLAMHNVRAYRKRLEYDRAALDAEWRQLDRIRRIRAVFFSARRAMQAEADRSNQPTANDPKGDK